MVLAPAEFVAAWTRLAAAWLARETTDAAGADALLDRALAVGVEAVLGELASDAAVPEVARADLVRAEIAVVRRSGAVDEDGYRAHNPKMAAAGGDPVANFCRTGWRNLRNPSLDFDGWWYRTEYLDPHDETLDPLLHYLLAGRFAGLLPLPVPRPREPARLPTDRVAHREVRRAVLFAAYDREGRVDDGVVAYVRELARHADVFVLYDGPVAAGELDRLDGLVRGAWAERHGAHDFGSWSRLARDLVGWSALAGYDEVLLVNDSCWLVRPLDEVFARMEARACDLWGLQLTTRDFAPAPDEPQGVPLAEVRRSWFPLGAFRYTALVHVGSYFLAVRRPVLDDPGFRRRLDAVTAQADRARLVMKYEIGLTQWAVGQGFEVSTWLPELRAYHPVYGPGVFDLLAEGFPVLKRRLLLANPFDVSGLDRWRERLLAAVPDAPVDLIEAGLERARTGEVGAGGAAS